MTSALHKRWSIQKGTCWRLARLESPPLAELVSPAELPELMAFLEVTVGLKDEPEWVERPFVSPNPYGSRFSDGTYGIFYAGMDLDTCVAEMAYHQYLYLKQSGAPSMKIHFNALRATVTGDFIDIRGGYRELHHPDDYAAARLFGVRAFQAQADGIGYRSVRHEGGECLAIFRRTCVLLCARAGVLGLDWNGRELTNA